MQGNTIYILGNGPSLRQMSKEETSLVGSATSIAMNRYILHYESVGVIPTHYLLFDADELTLRILGHLPEIFQHPDLKSVQLWLSPQWYERFAPVHANSRIVPVTAEQVGHAILFAKRFWKPSSLRHNLEWVRDRLTIHSSARGPFPYRTLTRFWASNTNQKLFRFQGTLTTALNLAWILGHQQVVLVGVDLTDGSHFYKDDPDTIKRDNEKFKIDSQQNHATTQWLRYGKVIVPPVQYIIRQIARLYRETGRELYVANPHSLLATEGIVPYRPILDFAPKS